MTTDPIRGNGNGPIRITGTVGRNKVDLVLEGVELRDFFGAAALLGRLDEYQRLETPKQRDQLARNAYAIADSVLRGRKRR